MTPLRTQRHNTAIEPLEPRIVYAADSIINPMDTELLHLIEEAADELEDIAPLQQVIDGMMKNIAEKNGEKTTLLQQEDTLERDILEVQQHQQVLETTIADYRERINALLVQGTAQQDILNQRATSLIQTQNQRNTMQESWDDANRALSEELASLRTSLARIGSALATVGKTVQPQIEKLIPQGYPKEIGTAVDMSYALRALTPVQQAAWNDGVSPGNASNELIMHAVQTWSKGSEQERIATETGRLDDVIKELSSLQEQDTQSMATINSAIASLENSILQEEDAWADHAEIANQLVRARTAMQPSLADIDAALNALWHDVDTSTAEREAEENEALMAEENLLTALEMKVDSCIPPSAAHLPEDVGGLTAEGDALLARTQNMSAVLRTIKEVESIIWSDGGKNRLAGLQEKIADHSFALMLDTQEWQEQSSRTTNDLLSSFNDDIDTSVLTPISITPIYADEPTELEQLLKIPTALAIPAGEGFQLLTNRAGMQMEQVDEATFVQAVTEECSMAESVAAWTMEDGYPIKKKPPRTEFDFAAFDGVPIPQGQNFGGGARTSIPGIGLVEAYSNELGLTFDSGSLIVTRSAMQGTVNSDVFGYALREGDPQCMRVTMTYTGTTPATLHFGIADQPGTDAQMDIEQGTHTYQLPKKASYVEAHSQDGRHARIERIEIVDLFTNTAGRNRPLELAAHAMRITDVMSALQYLATQTATLREQGLLPSSLAHLPKEIGQRIALLTQEASDIQTMQKAFEDLPWGSLSPASLASLFPQEGHENNLALSVMDFSGSAVSIAFRDPGFPVMVEIDRGAGMMGRRTAERNDAGGGMCYAQVAMDNAVSSGTYQIRILDPYTANKVIGSMHVVWDSVTKTMSLGNGATMFVPETYRRDDGITSFDTMILQTLRDEADVLTVADEATMRLRIAASIDEAFMTVISFDGYSNANIMAAERDALEAVLTPLCPELGCVTPQQFEQAFFDALPEWRWENKQQTMQRYRWDSIAFDQNRSAMWNRLNHNTGNYNEGIREMIAEGFNVSAMLRQGRLTEANTLMRTMQAKYDNRLSLPELHITAPHFERFVEACCHVLEEKPMDIMGACNAAEAETARRNYNAFMSPSSAGDGTEVVIDANGQRTVVQMIDYTALTAHGIDAGEARNLVHIAQKNLEHVIGRGASPDIIASMQNQLTLAMANYNVVQTGGTILTYQQQNQQNILAGIAEGVLNGRIDALAYLQAHNLPIPTSAFDDFFASQAGLDYTLAHMDDFDDLTSTLVAMGWLEGKGTLVATNLDDLRAQLITAGIGGAPATYELSSEQKEHALHDFLNLFQTTYAAQFPEGSINVGSNTWMSVDTLAGKIFAVLSGELVTRTGEDLDRLCAKAETILGIPADSLKWAGASQTLNSVMTNLTKLFQRAHLDSLFSTSKPIPSLDKTARIVSFHDLGDGSTYRLFFDTMLDEPYGVASVYVLNAGGSQIGTTAVSVQAKGEQARSIRGTLFVDIPSSALRDYIITETLHDGAGAGIANGMYSAHLILKLAVWQTDDVSQPGLPGNITTGVHIFSVPAVNPEVIPIKDLSTSIDPQRKALENEILSRLDFPLNGTVSINLETSGFHKADELYALDLSGGTATGVFAPTESFIEQVDLFAGQLILRHQLPSGELYFTTFYHLDHILENVTGNAYIGLQEALNLMDIPDEYKKTISDNINSRHEVKDNKLGTLNLPTEIKSKVQDIINSISSVQSRITDILIPQWENEGRTFVKDDGLLGIEGSEGASSANHVHMQFNLGSMKGEAIDAFHWLNEKQNGILTMTPIKNRSVPDSFFWSSAANALVNNTERIAMKRVDVKDDAGKVIQGESWAYAWEEGKTIDEMQRVEWIHNSPDGKILDAWIDVVNGKKWIPSSRSWQDI